MIYSVGFDLQLRNTGVEKAQFKRHELLKKNGWQSKLVYTRFNPHMSINARELGIEWDYISMYDFLQENVHVADKSFNWIEYWSKNMEYEIQYIPNTNDMRIYENNLFIMYVSFYDDKYLKLRYINYFDKHRTKIMREVYDARGFLSVKYLLKNNLPYYEQYCSSSGETKIEKFNIIEGEKVTLSKIILRDNYNRVFQFNNESQLRAYFFDQIYKDGDIFIIDRPLENAYPIAITKNKVPAYIFIHTTHFKDLTDIRDQIIKPTFRTTFKYYSYFKGLIVSTEEQKNDIELIVKDKIPVFSIPVGYIEKTEVLNIQEKNKNLLNNKKKYKIVSFGRYEFVKQLHHQIEVAARLLKDFPELEFHLFGFGSKEAELQQLIKDLNAENNIFINNFTHDVKSEYIDADLSMSTSYMEGFSLSILESLSNGVPVFAYDVKYGPSHLIEDKVNGELIPYGDKEALYISIKSYLSSNEKMERYKKNSLQLALTYTEENNATKWKKLLHRGNYN